MLYSSSNTRSTLKPFTKSDRNPYSAGKQSSRQAVHNGSKAAGRQAGRHATHKISKAGDK